MTRGQEGQQGHQDGGCHDDDTCHTCVTSHPGHVTVIIRLILILIRSMINERCAKTNFTNSPPCVPGGCWWSVEPVISVCDNAIQAANAMSHVSTPLPSTLQNSRIRIRLKISHARAGFLILRQLKKRDELCFLVALPTIQYIYFYCKT